MAVWRRWQRDDQPINGSVLPCWWEMRGIRCVLVATNLRSLGDRSINTRFTPSYLINNLYIKQLLCHIIIYTITLYYTFKLHTIKISNILAICHIQNKINTLHVYSPLVKMNWAIALHKPSSPWYNTNTNWTYNSNIIMFYMIQQQYNC